MYNVKEIIQNLIGKEDMKIEDIPSIYLYMDQVLSLFGESFPYNYGEQELTKTMINNYAKGGIIQPAYKKKYNKEHILMILITCMLKRELSLSEIKSLVEESVDKVDNLDKKPQKNNKKSIKDVDKKVLSNQETNKNKEINSLESLELENLEYNESEKLDIEEVYRRFLGKKSKVEKIADEHLGEIINILKDDEDRNKMLDVLTLCYCSNILSEAARSIIRGEIND